MWCHACPQCYCVQNTLRRIKSRSPCCVTLLSLSLCVALVSSAASPVERLQAQWQLLCCQVPALHIWRAFQESPVSRETMWFCFKTFACTRRGAVCVTVCVISLMRCLGLRGVASGSVKPWRDGCLLTPVENKVYSKHPEQNEEFLSAQPTPQHQTKKDSS